MFYGFLRFLRVFTGFGWFLRVFAGFSVGRAFPGFPGCYRACPGLCGFSGFGRGHGFFRVCRDLAEFVEVSTDLSGLFIVFPGVSTFQGTVETRWPHWRAPYRREGHIAGGGTVQTQGPH